MTNEEAIKLLVNATYSDEWQGNNDLQTAMHLAISALERDRWVSVEEPPKESGFYLFLYESHRMETRYHIAGIPLHRPVIAWRPLPEPPKEET
jgi:hypothetical protein